MSRTGLHTGTRFSVRSSRNGTEYTTLSQTRVKVSERVALVGDKRLPLLPQWFFNIGIKYEREKGREKVGVFLREAMACLISFSNLTFELVPKRI